MRFSSLYYLIVSVFLTISIAGITCLQHYIPKTPITISCETPMDEDLGDKFEDDKEHTTHIITITDKLLVQNPELYYWETHSSHPLETTVPPPKA